MAKDRVGLFQRVKNLWQLGTYAPLENQVRQSGDVTTTLFKPRAVFLMPDRVTEILKEKPDASIDDVLI